MNEPTKEPEDLIANALYLLLLCQQDINMGRWETVWPRADKARWLCQELTDLYFRKVKPETAIWDLGDELPPTGDADAKPRKPPRKRTKGLTPT